MAITYKDAGVDIDAGSALVDQIKPLAKSVRRPEMLSSIGGFAGLCAIPSGYRDPILVSGTDGVGTKLKIAFATDNHQTVGIDLVAMAVNDVAVTGAEPLFFLDYFATGKLDVDRARAVIAGVVEGCRQAGCGLLGGETAELPGLYQGSEYDLAGFCVGVVERDQIRDGHDIAVGDTLIGLPSSGLHSNGHSLARRVLLEELALTPDDRPPLLAGASVADELLRPTTIYVAALAALAEAGIRFKAAAHITGGGLVDNCPRMFPSDEFAVELDTKSWQVPPIFDLIASAGVELAELRRTFNMGIGMVLVCTPGEATAAVSAIAPALPDELAPRIIGQVVARNDDQPVRFI